MLIFFALKFQEVLKQNYHCQMKYLEILYEYENVLTISFFRNLNIFQAYIVHILSDNRRRGVSKEFSNRVSQYFKGHCVVLTYLYSISRLLFFLKSLT